MPRTPPAQPSDEPRESRQAKRTRAALLRAARTVFETKGYTKTRLEDITDEAGYAAGSFYTYFDSKESIFSEVIQSLGTNPDDHNPRRTQPTGPVGSHDPDALRRRIMATNERYFRSLATDARLWAVVEEAAVRDEAPRAILNERWRRYRSGVTTALKQWQSDGVIDSHRDLAAAVYSLSAMTEWLVTLRRVYGFSFPAPAGAAEGTWAWMRTLTAPTTTPPVRQSPRTPAKQRRQPRVARTETKKQTRARLIDAGLGQFSSASLSTVRIADITTAAGVSVGSFYKYFPSKSDLLAEVLTSSPSLLFAQPQPSSDSHSTIDAINRRHVTAVRSRAGLWRTVAEAALNDPLIRAIVNEQRAAWMLDMADLLANWSQDGKTDRTVDSLVAAICLCALTERSTHLRFILEDHRSAAKAIGELNDCWTAILRVPAT